MCMDILAHALQSKHEQVDLLAKKLEASVVFTIIHQYITIN